MPLPKVISKITERDLQEMISARTQEGTFIDFKRELPTVGNNKEKCEFVADVSAFANGWGGSIYYGIEEDGEGNAGAIIPASSNPDDVVLKLWDILMTQVAPRIPDIQIEPISVAGGYVLGIMVPQSPARPHRVELNNQFYIREGRRKRHMDIDEIKRVCVQAHEQMNSIHTFRNDRNTMLLKGEVPHKLKAGPALLAVHLVPLTAALGKVDIDLASTVKSHRLPCISGHLSELRPTSDGVLGLRSPTNGATHGYSLFFRNGFFESVVVKTAAPGSRALLDADELEQNIVQLVNGFRKELDDRDIRTDISCMVSLLHAKNIELGLDYEVKRHLESYQCQFDRDVIAVPEHILAGGTKASSALRPVFDHIWQAAGLPQSMNYDNDGEWRFSK